MYAIKKVTYNLKKLLAYVAVLKLQKYSTKSVQDSLKLIL